MFPVRSTTAAASVSSARAVAATVSTAWTSSAVRMRAGPPARSDEVFCELRGGVASAINAAATPSEAASRIVRARPLPGRANGSLDLPDLCDEPARIEAAVALELLEELVER